MTGRHRTLVSGTKQDGRKDNNKLIHLQRKHVDVPCTPPDNHTQQEGRPMRQGSMMHICLHRKPGDASSISPDDHTHQAGRPKRQLDAYLPT